ncbi:MAG: tRNA epoxyqueuosine(34) reductase QueG [Limisphaerales bacterium]
MKENIRDRARQLGFDDCRFTTAAPPDHGDAYQHWLDEGRHGELGWLERNAHKRLDPTEIVPGAKSIICLTSSYSGDTNNGESGPIARYARYRDYHDVIAEPLKELTTYVNEQLGEEPRSKASLWYTDTGPILERDAAQRAGLGFVGKHTNLISRQNGNWIFLSEIITRLEIEPDPPGHNRCGKCTACIDTCPTRAIIAPFELDARRCLSYLTIELKGSIPEEFRPAIGHRIYGCDDCLEVCPWNRFAKAGRTMREHEREDLKSPDLIELLALDETAFRERFRGTPMFRTKRRGVLRNVCVALGNTAGRESLPALETARQDAEALIAEHADWAIRQIETRST